MKDALDNILPGEIKIKWPNDIYYESSKMAGLLIENSIRGQTIESSVVGIGLNVNQGDFSREYNATSISRVTGIKFNLNEILNILLAGIGFYYLKIKNQNKEDLREKYHSSLLGINETKSFKDAAGQFEGKILGTDEYGRLIISKDNKECLYQHKQVQMLF